MKLEYEKFMDKAPPMQGFAVPGRIRRILPALTAALLFVFYLSRFERTDLFSKHTKFPRKIWQTWKIDPLGFEEKDLNLARSWVGKNPEYRYEVLTDKNDMAYVEREFGPDGLNRLDIVYTYKEVTARIIKADMLRYLVMYVEGGVYTDIDVEALRPIQRFVPDRFNERDVDLVIGVEIDQPEYRNHSILGQKCQSFCQWTFMAKPRQPVLLKLVENIIAWLKRVADEQKVGIADVELSFDQVISGTGPSAFTAAILEELTHRTGREVSWDPFHAIVESKLMGRILVLPVEAFAAGQGHSDSGNHNTKYSLVRHHYHASHWPDAHPRFKHPLVGQVEDCNWNADCVRKWDEDKLAFENMSPAEQQAAIAAKDAKDEEERKKKEEEERKQKEEEENNRRHDEEVKRDEEERDRRNKEEEDNRNRAAAEIAFRELNAAAAQQAQHQAQQGAQDSTPAQPAAAAPAAAPAASPVQQQPGEHAPQQQVPGVGDSTLTGGDEHTSGDAAAALVDDDGPTW